MTILSGIFCSSLGKKFIMAVTGLMLFGFVVGHLVGNLQIFLPDHGESLNRYGHFLQSNKEIVWPARIALLLAVALHIWAAARLTRENQEARPVGYAGDPNPVVASYASRTMMMSGLIILSFIIYHLLHFTVQTPAINFIGEDFKTMPLDIKKRHDIYMMMVLGFSHPAVFFFYILSMALLCLHLSHGVSALFQSLGLKTPYYGPMIDRFAKGAALLIFLGYASIPTAVWLGWVGPSK